MHNTHLDAIAFVQRLSFSLDSDVTAAVDVSLHPPFTALRSVQTVLDADRIPVALGAQDVHWEDKGAYTGEISPAMLAKLDVRYVIVGHSERRRYFGETDETVNRKVHAVLGAGMVPVVCVGEDADQRRRGATEDLVVGQVQVALAAVAPEGVARSVVAYEPLWAIGSGVAATSEGAQAVAAAVRRAVVAEHGRDVGAAVRIQYGGSVTADTVSELLSGPDVDGALVGGASLDAEQFARLVTNVRPRG